MQLNSVPGALEDRVWGCGCRRELGFIAQGPVLTEKGSGAWACSGGEDAGLALALELPLRVFCFCWGLALKQEAEDEPEERI